MASHFTPNIRLVNRSDGRIIVDQLQLATSWLERLVGWQFRSQPPSGSGLLLVPCDSVHTCFLRFSLDIALLDQNGCVLGVRNDLCPWRAILPVSNVFAVVEVPAGTGMFDLGSQLRLEVPVGMKLPKSLLALAKSSP